MGLSPKDRDMADHGLTIVLAFVYSSVNDVDPCGPVMGWEPAIVIVTGQTGLL